MRAIDAGDGDYLQVTAGATITHQGRLSQQSFDVDADAVRQTDTAADEAPPSYSSLVESSEV